MNICEPSNSFNCNSFNTRLKNDDWRPCQQLLLTRFVPVQCSNMFQTINQDYGSFYHNQRVSLCQPDVLKEKAYRQQERFANSFLTRMCPRTLSDKSGNSLFSQQNIETMKIIHRKKFNACHTDETIVDFFIKQIQCRLKDLINPCDYVDIFNCARLLIADLLNENPSLCADDIVDRVIRMMNVPSWCGNNNPSRLCADSCYPVTPPSSGLFLLTNPVFDC
ncbi:unnamed protein product [Adineta ricciae]|uniref:Uncharacterized protein n=1 Tax=Adineta ricciae TaxID=249248 RepID=A0A813MG01_ADIRI|nr:unnamed protein product [Adineta ricciae]